MTRYAIQVDDLFVAACYEPVGSGIMFTRERGDACSYVTIEKAAQIAGELVSTAGLLCNVVEIAH